MIDKITIFVPHLLMAIALWRLVRRDDLDADPALPNTHAASTRAADPRSPAVRHRHDTRTGNPGNDA